MSGRRYYFRKKAEKANRTKFLRARREAELKRMKVRKTLQKWKIKERLPVVVQHLEEHFSESVNPYRENDRDRCFAIHLAQRPTPELMNAFNDSFRKKVKQIRARLADNNLDEDVKALARIIADNQCKQDIRFNAMETMIRALAYQGNPVGEVFSLMGLEFEHFELLQESADQIRNSSLIGKLFGRSRRMLKKYAAELLEIMDNLLEF